MKTLFAVLTLAIAASPITAQSVKLTSTPKGIVADAGANGRVTFPPPVVVGTDNKDRNPTYTAGADGLTGKATYEDGLVIDIQISPANGVITYTFDPRPMDAKSVRVTALLPVSYAEGGTFSFKLGETKPFPVEKTPKLIAQGAYGGVDLITNSGERLTFKAPTSYQQIGDLRTWGTQSFGWVYFFDLLRYPTDTSFTIKISAAAK